MSTHHFSLTQQKIIVIAPMITGSLSLFSSLTVMVMILKSKKKLSSSYRRFIFGISTADVIFSMGHIASSLPNYSNTVWGAMGNQQTCEAQGITLQIGGSAGALYMTFFCIYFFTAIHFPMSKKKLAQKFEPFLHLFTIVFSLSTGLYLFVKGNYNPVESTFFCWISSFPMGCSVNGPVECIRGADAVQMRDRKSTRLNSSHP